MDSVPTELGAIKASRLEPLVSLAAPESGQVETQSPTLDAIGGEEYRRVALCACIVPTRCGSMRAQVPVTQTCVRPGVVWPLLPPAVPRRAPSKDSARRHPTHFTLEATMGALGDAENHHDAFDRHTHWVGPTKIPRCARDDDDDDARRDGQSQRASQSRSGA